MLLARAMLRQESVSTCHHHQFAPRRYESTLQQHVQTAVRHSTRLLQHRPPPLPTVLVCQANFLLRIGRRLSLSHRPYLLTRTILPRLARFSTRLCPCLTRLLTHALQLHRAIWTHLGNPGTPMFCSPWLPSMSSTSIERGKRQAFLI